MMNNTLRHTSLFILAAVLLLIVLSFLHIRSQESKSRHYAQLLSEADSMNRNYVPFTTDSIMLGVARHYDHWWHPDSTRMKAYYLLGCTYRDLNNAPRALENYQRAAELGDTTDTASLDRLMRIHSQMSELYMRQRLPEQMLAESRIAADLAWIIGDVRSALILETDHCVYLYNTDKYRECITEALKLYEKYKENGYKKEAPLVYSNCISSYLALQEYDNAKKYIDLYETCSIFRTGSEKVIGGLGSLYIYKGRYYTGVGQTDSAEFYYQKAKHYQNLSNNELLITKGLYKTYALKHQADSVLKYTQLYSDAKEKDFNSGIAEATAQARSLYDYSTEQKIAKQKSAEAENLYKLLLVAFVVFVLIVSYFLYSHKKKKQRIRELFQDYQVAIQERKETEEELIEIKKEQATDKNVIAQYYQRIQSQDTRIASLEKSIRKNDMRAKGINLADTDIVKRFETLRRQGRDNLLTSEDWKCLRKTIEEIYPTFHEHMNARQRLNESEYNVCLLVVSGFEPSDIDNLTQHSSSFASMTRKRLCAKVFGIDGKPTDFDRLLRQLY